VLLSSSRVVLADLREFMGLGSELIGLSQVRDKSNASGSFV
jgi:hypothetical protein